MADNGWAARVATAAGAAAGTGAAQLGLGYGLGVVVWPVTPTGDDSVWLGSLGWATWIAASATVFGAVIGARFGPGAAERPNGPWRFALSASAAIGALVTVALVALPARAAVRADTFSPHVIAAGYALIGLLFGLVVAYWAVVSRPVAANLVGTAIWLWALATTAIVASLTLHRPAATYLTSWQFAEVGADGRYGVISWPSALLTLGAAFAVGVVSVVPAVRLGNRGLGAATSGAAGPLLVAASFLVLAPRLTGALGPLESAYLIAPYAVLAGLAGSAATAAVAQAAVDRRSTLAAMATVDLHTVARATAKVDHGSAPEAAAADRTIATGVATVPAADPAMVPELAWTQLNWPEPVTKAEPGTEPEPADEPERADPEIAAAVRGRARAVTTVPADEGVAKATVTPPPASPAVARINPQPPAAR